MDLNRIARRFAMAPRPYFRMFAGTVGGVFLLLLALRNTVLPEISVRALSVVVLATAGVLMSYRFVLPFAYAWRLRSRRNFWVLLAVWLYLTAALGLAAGSGLDARVLLPVLFTIPLFLLLVIGLIITAVPGDVVRAQWSIRGGNFALGRAYLDRALARNPECTEAYLLRASLEYQFGRPEQALENYRIAMGLDPFNAAVYHGIGSLHYSEGDFAAAVDAFERTVDLQPGVAVHLYHLGLACRRTRRLGEAIDYLRHAIEFGLRPELASFAYYASGQAVEELNARADVERYYRRATELASRDVLEFWRGVVAKSKLIHRVDVRRYLSIVAQEPKEPPAEEEDLY